MQLKCDHSAVTQSRRPGLQAEEKMHLAVNNPLSITYRSEENEIWRTSLRIRDVVVAVEIHRPMALISEDPSLGVSCGTGRRRVVGFWVGWGYERMEDDL